jgi:hypothetical protein
MKLTESPDNVTALVRIELGAEVVQDAVFDFDVCFLRPHV